MTKGDKIYIIYYFIFYVILSLTFYNNDYIFINHLLIIPFIIIYIYNSCNRIENDGIVINKIKLIIILITILEFILLSFRDAAFQLYIVLSFLALYDFFKSKTINIDSLKIIVIVSILLVPVMRLFGLEEGQNVLTLIPSAEQQYIINFGSPGQTLHMAAFISGIFFISVCCSAKLGKRNYLLLTLSLYLLIFTVSRTIWLAAIASIIYIYHYKKNNAYEIKFSSVILLIFTSIIFFSHYLVELVPLISNEFMRTNDVDVSAGRSFLWRWHMQLFTEEMFGHGRQYMDQFSKGDVINEGVIPAWSESYFTYNFAEIGIFGICNIFYYLYVFKMIVKTGNLFKISIIIFAIITAVGSSLVTIPYTIFWFLTIPLIAANINIAKK